jgi:hypothetical protein
MPDIDLLRKATQDEYALVAEDPADGFHFLVGRPLAHLLGYQEAWLQGIPEPTIASSAGTGNPFSVGRLQSPPAWSALRARSSQAVYYRLATSWSRGA